jgi:hypothetical protein
MKRILCLSAALAITGACLFAEGDADARVAKQLDRLGLQYKTTSSGNFSLDKDLDGGRTQTVYLMSKTETYGGLEIREIWSNAGSMEEKPSDDQMMELLEDNNTEKLGAWSVEASDDGSYLIYFSIKVPVYLKDKDLSDAIDFAATVADEREAKLFDTDEN